MGHEPDNIPNSVKVFMTVFNRLGFPVMVCIWLAYQQFVQNKETIATMQSFKEVLIQVKDTLDQQNKILRHKQKVQED